MRQLLFILTLLLTNSEQSFGQTSTFTDTTFKVGDKLVASPIYFELNKAIIKRESYSYLDSLAVFLIENKNLVIEVGNHTDSRTSNKYSTCLSCKRAKVIVSYLISKGVPTERLTAIGYLDTKPIITDAEIEKLQSKEEIEKAHQINRRTEFKIVRVDY